MEEKIRVAYDTSILGAGYISYRARTGIFRVIEEILLELNQRSDISISSIALNEETTIWDDVSSQLYFETEHTELLSSFLSTHHSKLHLRNVYRKLIAIQRVLVHPTGIQDALRYKMGRALEILGSRLARHDAFISEEINKCDVYHGSYFPLPNAHILPNAQRVLTVYDLIPILFPDLFVPKVSQRAVKILQSIDTRKDWVICISEHTKKDFCQHSKMDPDRVFVTPLAASDYFYPVKNLPRIHDTLNKYKIPKSRYLLSLCTLEPRKNLDLLIRAFSEFVQSNPKVDLNLVLVGVNGWKNSSIFKALQENIRIKDRFFLTGYLPDEDLASIYSGALAFVYPSLYEGFGLPPLEAMQCGTPVVASNSSSLPEVVSDSGILVHPTNQSELSHAIWKLVNDSNLREELSKKSLVRAQQFSWSKCVDKTIEVYRTAANSK